MHLIAGSHHPASTAQLTSRLPLTRPTQERWERIVCTVAKTVVLSKFESNAELTCVLLSTGEKLIAEAAKNDCNWGIGLDTKQPEVAVPAQWRGANMLGWALMEARTSLRTPAIAPKRERSWGERSMRNGLPRLPG